MLEKTMMPVKCHLNGKEVCIVFVCATANIY